MAGLYPHSMNKIIEEQQRDHSLYFIEDGEAGFSPEHNKFVIDQTIKKTNALRKKKQLAYQESVRERADAVATYLKSNAAQSDTPVEKYFGKKWLAYLRGEKIMNVLKSRTILGGKSRQLYIPGN